MSGGTAPFTVLRRSLIALAIGLAVAAALCAAFQVPPKPDRYVTDLSGVLSPDRAGALNARLERFERETSNQVLVWIAPKIPDNATLEEFTVTAARSWRAGQAGKNNGAVLFVFTQERKMRIEVGYGLEGVLPDALAHRIQEAEILPRFRQGDYAGGVEAGAVAIVAATKGEYRGTGSTVNARSRVRSNSIAACGIPLLMIIGVVILFPFLYRRQVGRWRTYGGGGWWTGGGWGGFGSGGGGGWSGGGGGGFSGGGGSFGGGGSSGSW